jgi:hypothetical protein
VIRELDIHRSPLIIDKVDSFTVGDGCHISIVDSGGLPSATAQRRTSGTQVASDAISLERRLGHVVGINCQSGFIYVYPAIEMVEEWRLRRSVEKDLAQMCMHAASGHRWDFPVPVVNPYWKITGDAESARSPFMAQIMPATHKR